VNGDDSFVVDDQEDFTGQENETSERTFSNPSQENERKWKAVWTSNWRSSKIRLV
jgi:hypothetical protein